MLGSARKAVHDALNMGYTMSQSSMVEYLTYLSKIEKSRSTGIWAFVHRVQLAKVLAEINAQRPPVAQWLHFCYGPDVEKSTPDLRRTSLSAYIFDFLKVPPKVKLHIRNMTLAGCSLDDYKVRIWQGRSLPGEYFSEKMGTDPSHFWRDWKKKLDICLDQIKLLDSEGINNVSAVVRRINQEEQS